MVLGLLGALAGVIQYSRILDRIGNDAFTYARNWSAAKIAAICLLIIGLLGLVAILL